MEDLPLAEQERNQQPANTAVAVDEWVDRLELGVRQTAVDKDGETFGVVKKPLQVVEPRGHLIDRRRDEACRGQCATRRAKPVLGVAELSRRPVTSTYALEVIGRGSRVPAVGRAATP